MSLSSRKIGPVVLMLVLVHLFTPAAQASNRQEAFRSRNVLAAVWEWLGSMFVPAPERPGSQGAWEKAGSQMDPNGMLQSSNFAPNACDAGSQMDPDGYK